jgi:hypothetical protein
MAEASKQLGGLSHLQHGDRVNMQDGQRFALIVNNLSDFDPELDEDACNTIVNSAPMLVQTKRWHGTKHNDFVQHVYAERTVISKQGYKSRQMLVKAFNAPAWINIAIDDVLYNQAQYQAYKAQTH